MRNFNNLDDDIVKAIKSGKKFNAEKFNRRLDAQSRSMKDKSDYLLKKSKNLFPAKKTLPNKAMQPVNKMTGAKAAKLAGVGAKTSALGLGIVAGAAYYGGKKIVEARKKVEKVLDEQNANSKKSFDNAKKLQTHLQEQKAKTGMSLKQRQAKKKSNFPYGL